MRPLFKECFVSNWMTTTANTTDETTYELTVEAKKSKVWLIIVIVVVVIGIIVIIIGCVCYYKRRGNGGEVRYWKLKDVINDFPSTTQQTSSASVKSKSTSKSSVGSDAKHPAVRQQSSHSVNTQKSPAKKTQNEPKLKISPKLTNSSKPKVSPKK